MKLFPNQIIPYGPTCRHCLSLFHFSIYSLWIPSAVLNCITTPGTEGEPGLCGKTGAEATVATRTLDKLTWFWRNIKFEDWVTLIVLNWASAWRFRPECQSLMVTVVRGAWSRDSSDSGVSDIPTITETKEKSWSLEILLWRWRYKNHRDLVQVNFRCLGER